MLRRFAQKCAKMAGVDVRRATPAGDPLGWLLQFARRNRVTTILDVGANVGQFGRSVFAAGWTGKLLSFEPLTAAHAQLAATATRHPSWTVAPRGALGAIDADADMNIAGNSQSSSLLPMLERHAQAAPASSYIATEPVRVTTLDQAVAHLASDEVFLLKMDVQGFESEVFRGAIETLPCTL